MASQPMESDRREEYFWRDFPAMTDYFSPGIVPLLRYLGLSSQQVMHQFGEQVGRNAACKMAHLSMPQTLDESARIWEEYKIGQLSVEKIRSAGPADFELHSVRPTGENKGHVRICIPRRVLPGCHLPLQLPVLRTPRHPRRHTDHESNPRDKVGGFLSARGRTR